MEEGSWAIALVMVPCQAQSSRLSLTSLLDQLLLLAINKPLSKRPLRSTFDWRERAEREVFLSIFIHTHHTSSLATHTHIYTQPRHSTLAISWVTPSIGSLHLFFFVCWPFLSKHFETPFITRWVTMGELGPQLSTCDVTAAQSILLHEGHCN